MSDFLLLFDRLFLEDLLFLLEDISLLTRDFVLDFKLSMLEFVSSFSIVDFILDFRSSMFEFIFLLDGMSEF